jgi:hypothetical protein
MLDVTSPLLLAPLHFRQVGRRWIEFQAFPGPEARAFLALTLPFLNVILLSNQKFTESGEFHG